MPTYIQNLDYSIHTIKSVTHQLKVVEEIDISNNSSLLTISIIRNNSSDVSKGGKEGLTIKINDETVYNGVKNTPAPPAYGSDEVLTQTHSVSHNSSGGGNFTLSVTYKCDCVEDNSNILILPEIYYTHASAEITKAFTPIDRTCPIVSNISAISDRYGRNAFASFEVSHSSYQLKKVEFKLKDLTQEQAKCRDLWYDAIREGEIENSLTYVNNNYNGQNEDGSWYLRLIRDNYPNIGQEADIYFPLDDLNDNLYPLDSGKTYRYEIYAVCVNNVDIKAEGNLKVPQKVTGVTCTSQLDMIPGNSEILEYQVQPTNAEELSVKFHSTDNTVATVNEQGEVTAVGEGFCQIVVTTIDGGAPNASGFTQRCTVNVFNTETYPTLNEIRYLNNREIVRISAACSFLREKLLEKGLTVHALSDVICEGKSHPVKEIRTVLETINSNCRVLKNATAEVYPTEHLSEQQNFLKQNIGMNWYTIVNEWVCFLNELNNLIEKEV